MSGIIGTYSVELIHPVYTSADGQQHHLFQEDRPDGPIPVI